MACSRAQGSLTLTSSVTTGLLVMRGSLTVPAQGTFHPISSRPCQAQTITGADCLDLLKNAGIHSMVRDANDPRRVSGRRASSWIYTLVQPLRRVYGQRYPQASRPSTPFGVKSGSSRGHPLGRVSTRKKVAVPNSFFGSIFSARKSLLQGTTRTCDFVF